MQVNDKTDNLTVDIKATGLAELKQALVQIHRQLIDNEKYILYTIGEQQSLLKVDRISDAYKFTFCDRIGRPATPGFINTLADFLWEDAGLKQQYAGMAQSEWQATVFKKLSFQDLSREMAHVSRQADMLEGKNVIYAAPVGSLEHAKSLLMRAPNSGITKPMPVMLSDAPSLGLAARQHLARAGLFAATPMDSEVKPNPNNDFKNKR